MPRGTAVAPLEINMPTQPANVARWQPTKRGGLTMERLVAEGFTMTGRSKKAGSRGRRVLLSTFLGLGILASALEGVSTATDYYCHTVANSYCGQYYHNGWTPTCLWLGGSDGSSRGVYQKRADGSFPRIGTVYFRDANGDAF